VAGGGAAYMPSRRAFNEHMTTNTRPHTPGRDRALEESCARTRGQNAARAELPLRSVLRKPTKEQEAGGGQLGVRLRRKGWWSEAEGAVRAGGGRNEARDGPQPAHAPGKAQVACLYGTVLI
jgi:hypothetical protein